MKILIKYPGYKVVIYIYLELIYCPSGYFRRFRETIRTVLLNITISRSIFVFFFFFNRATASRFLSSIISRAIFFHMAYYPSLVGKNNSFLTRRLACQNILLLFSPPECVLKFISLAFEIFTDGWSVRFKLRLVSRFPSSLQQLFRKMELLEASN